MLDRDQYLPGALHVSVAARPLFFVLRTGMLEIKNSGRARIREAEFFSCLHYLHASSILRLFHGTCG